MLQKHINRDRLTKRLCIDCKYCSDHEPIKKCAYYKDRVDGKPKYTCYASRLSDDLCGEEGLNFTLSSEVIVHETEEQVLLAHREMLNSRSFMEKLIDLIFCGVKFKN